MATERRYQLRDDNEPLRMLCRECWTLIALLPERLLLNEGRAFYRCQHCGLTFFLRNEDAELLKARQAPR